MAGAERRLVLLAGALFIAASAGPVAGAHRARAAAQVPPGEAPVRPAGAERPPRHLLELRQALRNCAELRIRDLARAAPLGLERTERLLGAAERGAARLAEEPANAAEARFTVARAERLWEEPAWTEATSATLGEEERAALGDRRRVRLAARERAAAQLAAALLSMELQLAPASHHDLIRLASERGEGVPEEGSPERLSRAWQWAASSVGELSAAQRRRLVLGSASPASPGAGGERTLLEADLEVWVAAVAERGQLSEQVRGLLFDCGRRSILVALSEDGPRARPIDDPILEKALATLGGVELARTVAAERRARETSLATSRTEWIVAELDALLWLTEVQSGALRLVLSAAAENDRPDLRLPIASLIAAHSPETRSAIEAILDPLQTRVLERVGGEEEEP